MAKNNTEVAEGLTNNFEVESLAFTETCLDIKFHVYWYYGYWVTCLQEEKEENMDKMGKLFLAINFTYGDLLLQYSVYRLVFGAVKSLQV